MADNVNLISNYDTYSRDLMDIEVSGDKAFIVNTDEELIILDIADPSTPALVGKHDIPYHGYGAYDIEISGDYAFIVDGYGDDLVIMDISNPLEPSIIINTDISGYSEDIEIEGTIAYIASGSSGVNIIDISQPSQPSFIDSFDTLGYAEDVEVVGNLAFVADNNEGVAIFDLSNLTFIGRYKTSGYAQDVEILGSRAFVAEGSEGLSMIDISSPSNPSLLDNYATSGYVLDVEIVRDKIFIVDNYKGLFILEASSSDLFPLDSYQTSQDAVDVEVVNGMAFVACDEGILEILDVSHYAGLVTENKPPTGLSLSNDRISENTPKNTLVGVFSTIDQDTGDSHTYSLVTNSVFPDNTLFTIDANQLYTNSVFDFNTGSSYKIHVQTEDASGSTYRKIFTIEVTQSDHLTPAIIIAKADDSITVAEGGESREYTIELNTKPSADVTINLDTEPRQEIELFDLQNNPLPSITFTEQTWNIPQTVQIQTIDDHQNKGTRQATITHTIAEGSADEFTGIEIDEIIVGITDNDLATTSIDMDGNEEVTGSTDGLLIVRALNGVSPLFITQNALGDGATITDGQTIIDTVNQLADNQTIDIDGNGEVTGSTDGLLIVRALNGVSPLFITQNALGDGATITDGQTIIDHVHDLSTNLA